MRSRALIETERLCLRPIGAGDLGDLMSLHEDAEVGRFMGAPTREWLEDRIGSSDEEWSQRGHGLLAVIERDGGAFLGRAGLKHWPQFDEVEAGWALRAEARGKGFATEAARALLRWGFESFDPPYITAMIRPDNAPSIAVAERLGMSPMREDELYEVPVVVWATRRTSFR